MSNGLIREKYKQFSKENPQFNEILNILYENTQYFTNEQILSMIKTQIIKWKFERQNSKLYILLNKDKIGSEHYIYYKFRNELPEHKLIRLENDKYIIYLDKENQSFDKENIYKEINESEILYLDDWSLSGCNLLANIDEFTYPLLELNKIINFNYTAIVALGTEESLAYIKNFTSEFLNSNIYVNTFIPRFDKILKLSNIDYDTSDICKNFSLTFSPDTEGVSYPVHLEYKIANQFGSYPIIYEQCRNLPNKDYMIEINDYFNKIYN